ncbi:peptidylprolyl isomerase [Dactylosporangium roseum]|uniref:Peptidylprolyl isomerase n=2 Tax=Dactylosporangium roseum TaxID=47989 RepID=A0ABY5ZEN9_9ACTN|nr:peptidylprolyl isomerase [Dactylosporangium roseum]
MADRAERSRIRRRRNTMIAAGAGGLVVLLGVAWLVVALTKGDDTKTEAGADPSASATPTNCTWLPLVDPSASPKPEIPKEVKDVGTPPASGEPRTGKQLMTLDTSVGAIKIEMDTAHAPCAAASFTYLAGKKFFDGSKCHRLVTSNIFVLQCGDPSATGLGGPTYRYAEENLPTGRRPAYTEGMVAIAKTQDPNSSGSQFFIVYKDIESLQADYTVLGKVTEGLDLVKKVAEAGVIPDAKSQSEGDGAPKTEVKINTMTIAPVQG